MSAGASGRARRGAAELATMLGLPAPTEQQARVIEAPIEGPAIVIAGAGSGKTETMAARVVWLVANGLVDPEGVLGLTFTRKAAAELAARVRRRLRMLAHALGAESAPSPGRGDDPFAAPEISTYHSFAAAVYREHALRIGCDPDAVLLGDAAAWQLAREVVLESRDQRIVALDQRADRLAEVLLALARGLAEHRATGADVAAFAAEMVTALAALPKAPRQRLERKQEVARVIERVGALPLLVDLAEEYRRRKRSRGLIEFADLVADARSIVEAAPVVAEEYRRRFPVVILDEYQDTDVGQAGLLSALFRGAAVMAVGDPHQSIYGWRGASAEGLDGFPGAFGDPAAPGAARFSLSTSWRNDRSILAAANAVVAGAGSTVAVERLAARPTAGEGEVAVRVVDTAAQEAAAVAEWFAERLLPLSGAAGAPGGAGGADPPTAAVLLRSLRHAALFADALAARGVPCQVLGIGGLLEQPAVADLVAALRVVHSVEAGAELIRLLSGAGWAIGPADLWRLRELAHWLHRRDHAQQELEAPVVEALRRSVDPAEGASLVEALEFIATAPPGHHRLQRFGDEALARLRAVAELLQRLRRRAATAELTELVRAAIAELRLDVETAANERRDGRGALDSFLGHAADYRRTNAGAGLGGFLAWLTQAERRDRLAPRPEPARPGVVQLLTIHGSKGLEWDLVAVPRLVEDELPNAPRAETGMGWLALGALPWEFRGDAAGLPELGWAVVEHQGEYLDAETAFKEAVRERALGEERRLAYVAITRAARGLLLTASFWAGQQEPRVPSRFLREIVAALPALGPLPEAPGIDRDEAYGAAQPVVEWPLPPLGLREAAVRAAAAAVRSADPMAPTPWQDDIELLLAERSRRSAERGAVALPPRVPASRFKDYLAAPDALAAELRRPMPERPFRQTRLGTLFHAWVERRAGLAGAIDPLDAPPGADADESRFGTPEPGDAAALAELQAVFERSEWADRRPEAVELELNLPLAGRTVICKLDAVYPSGEGRWQIVDWKTGRAPTDAAELEQRQYQLALYRLAYAEWRGIAPAAVDAVLYYVADDLVIRPDRLMERDELERRWRDAVGSA